MALVLTSLEEMRSKRGGIHMRKIICLVWVALMVLLYNVADIGNMRAYADWQTATGTWTCSGALKSYNFTPTKNTYVFGGNCVWGGGETAHPLVPFEISAEWDRQTRTATEDIRGAGFTGRTVVSCSADPWLNYNINCSVLSIQGNVSPESLNVSVPAFWMDEWRRQAGLPITRAMIGSAQKDALGWQASDVVIVVPTQDYRFPSPDRVAFNARVESGLPVPGNAVMEFRISEDRWPNADQPPLKVYEASQKILSNGYANLPFKDLFPGQWRVAARIQGQQGWRTGTKFYVEGSLRAPTNLKAELTGKWQMCEHRDIKLTWQAPDVGQRGFAIESRRATPDKSSTFQQIATVAWDKREYVDTSDKLGGEYYYRVKALPTVAESIYSDAKKIVLENVHKPNPPSNLRSVSGNKVAINVPIKLSWKDNSDNEDGFAIERKDPGSDKFKELHITGPNVQEWTDSSSKPAGIYIYHIRVNSKGCSSHSNTISVQVYNPKAMR